MITKEDVHYISNLARLRLSCDEVEAFTGQLTSILAHAQELQKVNTEGVDPTALVSGERSPLRDDIEHPSLSKEDALRNAPLVKNGFFAVPKVIG
jgi:aspartyl-tRNA(Asn)/glutamyl-tRNA(Gln) amidotransferase subunit C